MGVSKYKYAKRMSLEWSLGWDGSYSAPSAAKENEQGHRSPKQIPVLRSNSGLGLGIAQK